MPLCSLLISCTLSDMTYINDLLNHASICDFVILWLFYRFQAKAASALSQHDYSISRLKTCWDSLQTDRTAGSFLTLVTSSFPSAKVRIKGSGSDRGQCQVSHYHKQISKYLLNVKDHTITNISPSISSMLSIILSQTYLQVSPQCQGSYYHKQIFKYLLNVKDHTITNISPTWLSIDKC